MGVEASALQVVVDLQACPGVDGCVALLGVGELGGFPVGELLSLADLVLEEDGVNLLQAHVGDLVLLDEGLQLDEAGGVDVGDAGELVEVVAGGEADLDAGFVLEQALEGLGDACLVECAHSDRIWACGIRLTEPERFDIDKWTGKNLLGFALMEVRRELREQLAKAHDEKDYMANCRRNE